MSNKYNSDNSAIIDATGKEWPVETAHPLPCPNGIDADDFDGDFLRILFGRDGKWYPHSGNQPTHWLARRPLPEVPKVKTQDELDREAFDHFWAITPCMGVKEGQQTTWHAAIAYARQCPSTPAQQQPAA